MYYQHTIFFSVLVLYTIIFVLVSLLLPICSSTYIVNYRYISTFDDDFKYDYYSKIDIENNTSITNTSMIDGVCLSSTLKYTIVAVSVNSDTEIKVETQCGADNRISVKQISNMYNKDVLVSPYYGIMKYYKSSNNIFLNNRFKHIVINNTVYYMKFNNNSVNINYTCSDNSIHVPLDVYNQNGKNILHINGDSIDAIELKVHIDINNTYICALNKYFEWIVSGNDTSILYTPNRSKWTIVTDILSDIMFIIFVIGAVFIFVSIDANDNSPTNIMVQIMSSSGWTGILLIYTMYTYNALSYANNSIYVYSILSDSSLKMFNAVLLATFILSIVGIVGSYMFIGLYASNTKYNMSVVYMMRTIGANSFLFAVTFIIQLVRLRFYPVCNIIWICFFVFSIIGITLISSHTIRYTKKTKSKGNESILLYIISTHYNFILLSDTLLPFMPTLQLLLPYWYNIVAISICISFSIVLSLHFKKTNIRLNILF